VCRHCPRWQSALIEKLNREAGAGESDAALAGILRSYSRPKAAAHRAHSGCCRRGCSSTAEKAALDESVQWLGVRDFLQEAEVAAGMVQRMLAEDASLTPADIGLLLPDEFEYAVAVEDAFRLAGLALSGLPASAGGAISGARRCFTSCIAGRSRRRRWRSRCACRRR
jgi:ATP-dependent helicase/nuclease subunit B